MNQLSSLPLPIKILLTGLSGGCMIGAAYMIDPRAVWIVVIGLLVVGVVFGLYLLVLRMMNQRRADAMGGQMTQHSGVTPRGLSDPAQRAKLDNLRQTWTRGLEKFRAAGKDIYSLPWYMVVGEPGAGKSEAVRHSNVGFPPGLQDELQGSGGTINMHWWFANSAIFLDTAGRLMFEEVPPGSTSEWREFLGLLRKARPNCPINGLMLVIPADSLIKDSADEIARKATRIAQQLNTIQSALDVRFPVFILITKTDLINGFREFFEHVKDPHLQHQMLGWSNPGSLDDQYRPEQVDQHLQLVVERIRRRRLGLLQDPTPQSDFGSGRRIDEVDALFALPASLTLLAPRLRRYLEMIFMPNDWASKPLFLRGIYFTSAMREGSALDLDLAEAIGVPVDSLPEGKRWEKERAYFLRDMFVEKVFREKGLVTRASNTKTMLRKRQALFFGLGFVGLFLLLGFSWIGARGLKESVGRERDYWLVAADGWDGDSWRPIVSPEFKGSQNFVFNGPQEIEVGSETITLAEYHQKLAELAQSDIKVPWVFKPLNQLVAGANPSRRKAQRIVFEGGVLKPLVSAARDKVSLAGDQWGPRSSDALAFLLRLEGMIQYRGAGLTAEELSASGFLSPLGGFLWNDPNPDDHLSFAFDWVYAKGGDGRGYWPPRWLSAGISLVDNRPIGLGLSAFIRSTQERQSAQELGFERIKEVRAGLRKLRLAEDELLKVGSAGIGAQVDFQGTSAQVSAFLRERSELDQAIETAMQSGVFTAENFSLHESYKSLVEETRRQTEEAFELLQTEVSRFANQSLPSSEMGAAYTLPAEIGRRLKDVQQQIKAKVEGTFDEEELAELKQLDGAFLDADTSGIASYSRRGDLYGAIAELLQSNFDSGSVVGGFSRYIDEIEAKLVSLDSRVKRYEGGRREQSIAVAERLVGAARLSQFNSLYARYIAQVDDELKQRAAFPLLMGSPNSMRQEDLPALETLLRTVRTELPLLRGPTMPQRYEFALELLSERVVGLGSIAETLMGAEGNPTMVTLRLPAYADQRREITRRLVTEQFAAQFVGSYWRTLRVNTRRLRTEAPVEEIIMKFPVSSEMINIDFFKGIDDAEPDRNFTAKGRWALLRLLSEPNVRRRIGGREWEIQIMIQDDAGRERHLLLLFEFEKPLPEVEQWPTANSLGL